MKKNEKSTARKTKYKVEQEVWIYWRKRVKKIKITSVSVLSRSHVEYVFESEYRGTVTPCIADESRVYATEKECVEAVLRHLSGFGDNLDQIKATLNKDINYLLKQWSKK